METLGKKITPEMLTQLKAILLEKHMLNNVFTDAIHYYPHEMFVDGKLNMDNTIVKLNNAIEQKYQDLRKTWQDQGYFVPRAKYVSYGFQTNVG